MPLNQHFHHQIPEDPSNQGPKEGLTREPSSPSGTLPWLLPTHANFHVGGKKLQWNSRDHRKGRHPVEDGKRRRISRFFWIEWWNISWWWFTLGSAVWVINGFLVFLPILGIVADQNKAAQGWTAFTGGTIFEIGSFLMVLESLNRKHTVCFGDAVLGAWSHCTHHFHNQTRSGSTEDCAKERDQQWKWFGARWREIGYDASAIQAVAATVFWISTITGIPGVIDMNNVGLTDGIYWVPQVIGGSGFIISSLLFLLETQPKWYHIRPFDSLGWHVGFWNLVGGLGFTLCGAFGIAQSQTWAEYQSGCSTFWGSWAFLIGSIAQWIEALNR